MTRLPALLLRLGDCVAYSGLLLGTFLACSGERAPRPTAMIDSAVVDSPAPFVDRRAMARPSGSVTADTSRTSDTTRWADTTRPNDSTIDYGRGKAVNLTVTIRIRSTVVTLDTSWSERLHRPALGVFEAPASPPFSLSLEPSNPATIVQRITLARNRSEKLVLAMTGGGKLRYMANGKFDLGKWKAVQQTFNTPAIRTAVAQAVSDGTVIGNQLMDEPNHDGWKGSVTKALVDSMAAYAKTLFPTLPVGYAIGPRGYGWRTTERVRVVDWRNHQYNWFQLRGNVAAWRDSVVSQAKRDGVALSLGLNVLDGGIHVFDVAPGAWFCPTSDTTVAGKRYAATGGRGTYAPACQMTPEQIKSWGTVLAQTPGLCGFFVWRYDADFVVKQANLHALTAIAAQLTSRPFTACRRRV